MPVSRAQRQRSLAFRLRTHGLLLLLPLVAVAVAAGVGQLVTSGIDNDLSKTGREAQQLSRMHDDLNTVANAGLNYLVFGSAGTERTFTTARAQVDADLHAWNALPRRSSAQRQAFENLQHSWTYGAPDRTAVINAGAQSAETVEARAATAWLNSDIQTSLADVERLQQINATQLASLQTDRNGARSSPRGCSRCWRLRSAWPPRSSSRTA